MTAQERMTPQERPTPQEIGAVLGGEVSLSGGGAFARPTVDVPPAHWVAAVTAARDQLGCDFFDWLTAVDEREQGYRIVVHVWSTARRYGVLVRTLVESEVDSLIGVYPGAAWPERETHEMFGVHFAGHPDLAPLLLPPQFEGHPLRKDFVLATRVAKAWPGAIEPGESTVDRTGRRPPPRPPGVPAPGEWGAS